MVGLRVRVPGEQDCRSRLLEEKARRIFLRQRDNNRAEPFCSTPIHYPWVHPYFILAFRKITVPEKTLHKKTTRLRIHARSKDA